MEALNVFGRRLFPQIYTLYVLFYIKKGSATGRPSKDVTKTSLGFSRREQVSHSVGFFPRKLGKLTTKVTVAGAFFIDGAQEVEALGNMIGAQVKNFVNGFGQDFV